MAQPILKIKSNVSRAFTIFGNNKDSIDMLGDLDNITANSKIRMNPVLETFGRLTNVKKLVVNECKNF